MGIMPLMMDDSEKLVEAYLISAGFTDVRHEPCKNSTPDFLIDGRIAVEVRRLNQNFDDKSGKGLRGLEETDIPLSRSFEKYLTELGPAPASGRSWFVFYAFSRPDPAWKDLKRQLDGLLKPFMASDNPQPFEARLNANFKIEISLSPSPSATFFVLIGGDDEQSGGWTMTEIDANLKHCIIEKTAKIANHRAKYPEWWLILPDHIGHGLGQFRQKQFLEHGTVQPGGFDRIILLDPQDASRDFQVYP
jgi:hypothetical protein